MCLVDFLRLHSYAKAFYHSVEEALLLTGYISQWDGQQPASYHLKCSVTLKHSNIVSCLQQPVIWVCWTFTSFHLTFTYPVSAVYLTLTWWFKKKSESESPASWSWTSCEFFSKNCISLLLLFDNDFLLSSNTHEGATYWLISIVVCF